MVISSRAPSAADDAAASSARGAAAPSMCRPKCPRSVRSRDACSPRRRAARRSPARRRAASRARSRNPSTDRAIATGAGNLSKMPSPRRAAAAERLRAEAFDDDVHGEPMKPGGKGRVAAEGAELLPDADEDILGQLIGVAAARHPAHETVHPRQVRVIDPLECRHVSRRGQRHVVSHVGRKLEHRGRTGARMRSKLLSCTSLDGSARPKGWKPFIGEYRKGRWGCLPTSAWRPSA